jgi:hypothetical protein
MSRPLAPCGLIAAAAISLAPATSAFAAGRETVLKQIDLPHNYYYREMYLPQLTNGPSALTWSPDGSALVYSMQGSLWRQAVGDTTADQLTDGPGYDYQPDWSPDGRSIVFARYIEDAVQLYVLDVAGGNIEQLTQGNAVNLEPRWSPDGAHIAFVSTMVNGHFHVFIGTRNQIGFVARPLLFERKSELARYYYSPYDHELSPSWSPDGKEVLFVSNRDIRYGTGSLWRMPVQGAKEPVLVRAEETTWRARPDWSRDGKRIVYASYLGRQWHQLWLATAAGDAGGDPFPLTYGDYDATGARWSPDGTRIAYVANESGDTGIRIVDVPGGAVERMVTEERRWLHPRGTLEISVVDERGRAVPARVAVLTEDERSYAPDGAWMHADDGFDRRRTSFETHYFHSDGRATLEVPAGAVSITAWRGLEHAIARGQAKIEDGKTSSIELTSAPLDLPKNWSREWQSGDLHVHMNYAGNYRATPATLVAQARAEDLDIVWNLVVNKEQRVPDIAYFSPQPDAASTNDVLLLHGQEYHTSLWGHLGLLGLDDHYLVPGYAAYPGTAAASWYPTNAAVADLAHAQHALVGYVHPFDTLPDPAKEDLRNELPVDVALGKVDYYEAVGFSDPRATNAVWYRLLNCGFRLSAGAGTDAMTNYASLRGPVGVNRVYVHLPDTPADPARRRAAFLADLRAGHTMATNGPLLGLTIDDQAPGGELALPAGVQRVHYRGFMRSIVPVDHVELVRNGEVVATIDLAGERTSADIEGDVEVDRSGWLLLRAWNDGASPEVFDIYPWATTNPVYLTLGGAPPRSPEDARYFRDWIADLEAGAEADTSYNTPAERAAILEQIRSARAAFEKLIEAVPDTGT